MRLCICVLCNCVFVCECVFVCACVFICACVFVCACVSVCVRMCVHLLSLRGFTDQIGRDLSCDRLNLPALWCIFCFGFLSAGPAGSWPHWTVHWPLVQSIFSAFLVYGWFRCLNNWFSLMVLCIPMLIGAVCPFFCCHNTPIALYIVLLSGKTQDIWDNLNVMEILYADDGLECFGSSFFMANLVFI